MSKKRALITGITGQDGSYLAEFLLEKGYEVHGIIRRVAFENENHRLSRVLHIKDSLILHAASLENYASIFSVIEKVKPDECYHLAAQTFVIHSFEDAFSTLNININGTLFVLSAIKEKAPDCKFYFAGSSEMFGKVKTSPQNENTPFHPRSPYGISKVAGFNLTRNFRESYGLFACSGILFNHESPRRGSEFVTRKIIRAVVRIKSGSREALKLGNLNAKRDWGYAKDYVKAMWLMLQQEKPDDFVIATGETHTVREFLEKAFGIVGVEVVSVGSGLKETYFRTDIPNSNIVVEINPDFFRPAEVHLLAGDASEAKKQLGWEPKIKFEELVRMMVESDFKKVEKELK